jgi:hypothetical protein
MITDRLSSLKDYLVGTGAHPLPPGDIPEERAPDLLTATSSSAAREVARVEINPSPGTSPLFRFFVDGVQRTVPVAEVTVNNVQVPIHLSHLIVGAMERAGAELKPFLIQEAFVLIFPYQALQAADPAWSARRPPGRELESMWRHLRSSKKHRKKQGYTILRHIHHAASWLRWAAWCVAPSR